MSLPSNAPRILHLQVDLTIQETEALFNHLNQWASPANLLLKRKLRAAIHAAGGPRTIPADEVLAHALTHARSVINRLPTASPADADLPSA